MHRQTFRFLTTLDLRRLKFSKIKNCLVALKIGSKLRILPFPICGGWNLAKPINNESSCDENRAQNWPWTCEGWSLAKFNNFWSHENLAQNWKLSFLTTTNLWRLKFGIHKCWVTLTLWLKIEIFDNSRPAKDDIWQNPKMLSSIENLAQIWDFWPLRTCEGSNMAKSGNFETHWKFGSNLRFCDHSGLAKRGMKFGKIHKCRVTLKIWLKSEIFDHSEPVKDEIWASFFFFFFFKKKKKKWVFCFNPPFFQKIV